MHLRWHNYRYYPYERDLAQRELQAVLGFADYDISENGIRLQRSINAEAAERLTYFSHVDAGTGATPTIQGRLENAASNGRTRQATRYSAHGLHEYKGKFNPQVAKAILNIFGAGHGSRVLDPFCGSGTALVECAHLGAVGFGTDLNPLAVFLANSKLACLRVPTRVLRKEFILLSGRLARFRSPKLARAESDRDNYLRSWFDTGQLAWIETIRRVIGESCEQKNVFLALASNLLRDYSHQDPNDLRIRRRTSALPVLSFREAFERACVRFLDRLEAAQVVLGVLDNASRAVICDIRTAEFDLSFDAAITSPPYATALPYIDTQRLSLVWLGLCEPDRIAHLDASLIGSRELKKREQLNLAEDLTNNARGLPSAQFEFCSGLARAVGVSDGFRRRAVPALVYRYLADMRDGFRTTARLLRTRAPYALIVGHNHTVLSGVRQDIDTPFHLAALARSVGWEVEDMIPLQTYARYGLHAVNSVAAETLLILRNK